MAERRAAAIIREMNLVSSSKASEEVKKNLLVQLEEELEGINKAFIASRLSNARQLNLDVNPDVRYNDDGLKNVGSVISEGKKGK